MCNQWKCQLNVFQINPHLFFIAQITNTHTDAAEAAAAAALLHHTALCQNVIAAAAGGVPRLAQWIPHWVRQNENKMSWAEAPHLLIWTSIGHFKKTCNTCNTFGISNFVLLAMHPFDRIVCFFRSSMPPKHTVHIIQGKRRFQAKQNQTKKKDKKLNYNTVLRKKYK